MYSLVLLAGEASVKSDRLTHLFMLSDHQIAEGLQVVEVLLLLPDGRYADWFVFLMYVITGQLPDMLNISLFCSWFLVRNIVTYSSWQPCLLQL